MYYLPPRIEQTSNGENLMRCDIKGTINKLEGTLTKLGTVGI
jgi:hypothetical protein